MAADKNELFDADKPLDLLQADLASPFTGCIASPCPEHPETEKQRAAATRRPPRELDQVGEVVPDGLGKWEAAPPPPSGPAYAPLPPVPF
ncbi:Hypothetical predicted protein [Cloeon dipterum]|uniref:Uncharacterized protein n=1 Tax=Cloeon dipterum TaxID=197152 RepID=A0A8S1DH51_9INSE|nr:Hypothetical predicted protein [Cloeon dipterum]